MNYKLGAKWENCTKAKGEKSGGVRKVWTKQASKLPAKEENWQPSGKTIGQTGKRLYKKTSSKINYKLGAKWIIN